MKWKKISKYFYRGSSCGQKETRYYDSLVEAYAAYNDIYKKKTAAGKGYKPLNLVRMNSNIGSQKVKGKSAGNIDEKTLKKMEEDKNPEKKVEEKPKKTLNLHPAIENLITYLYVISFAWLKFFWILFIIWPFFI